MTAVEEIRSIGPPPVRHSDRIVAGMLRHLAEQSARLWAAIEGIIEGPYVRDGNERAQRRLEARVKALGAMTFLEPGKRGKYCLRAYHWCGYSPVTDTWIGADDDIPPKPWLAHKCYQVEGMGRCRVRYLTGTRVMISVHALSRVTQRWQAKNLSDILRVVDTIGAVGLNYIADNDADDAWYKTPANGVRVPFPNRAACMVLKAHATRKALIVATIF
jgi:hypothetical protein